LVRYYCPDCNAREEHDEEGNCLGCRMDAEKAVQDYEAAYVGLRRRLYPTAKEEREYRILKARHGIK
jgi:hypothetical protein